MLRFVNAFKRYTLVIKVFDRFINDYLSNKSRFTISPTMTVVLIQNIHKLKYFKSAYCNISQSQKSKYLMLETELNVDIILANNENASYTKKKNFCIIRKNEYDV